jgi:hypothetical protein
LSRLRKVMAASLASAMMLGIVAFPAAASDHVVNAAGSQGSDDRGFTNPVTTNPSDGKAQGDPSTVPGEGDPKSGAGGEPPAVNLDLVDDRSGEHGDPNA